MLALVNDRTVLPPDETDRVSARRIEGCLIVERDVGSSRSGPSLDEMSRS
jgi:hypothetical protein